jgi:hypothetical protein
MIKDELKKKEIEVEEIEYYLIAKKLYLFTIICTDKRGALKLRKSTIKHIAKSDTKGNNPLKYLVYNDTYWSA